MRDGQSEVSLVASSGRSADCALDELVKVLREEPKELAKYTDLRMLKHHLTSKSPGGCLLYEDVSGARECREMCMRLSSSTHSTVAGISTEKVTVVGAGQDVLLEAQLGCNCSQE